MDVDAVPRLVIATRNAGKLAEFSRLLAGTAWRVVGLGDIGFRDEIDEPFDDYASNARRKAETVAATTDLPVLADDSGIEVLALRGWPGPASARWMGESASDNDRLLGLIAEVDKRSADDRRVRYVAALALAQRSAETVVAHGMCDGMLVEPRGSAGFGYDPAFYCDELGCCFGEADAAAKDTVSHRARALHKLVESGALDAHLAAFS